MKSRFTRFARVIFLIVFILAQAPTLTAYSAPAASQQPNSKAAGTAGMGAEYALSGPGPAPSAKYVTVSPDKFKPRETTSSSAAISNPINVGKSASDGAANTSKPTISMFRPKAAAPLPSHSFQGGLEIEPITAYNLIVDSNVLAPSSYGPNSATLGAKFCNRSGATMNNVTAYIGNYAANTPGTYAVISPAQAAANTGNAALGSAVSTDYGGPVFSLSHASGNTPTATDATRYIGTLADQQCVTEYWLVNYPRKAWNGTSWIDVTGGVKPDDDLWLPYDFWATSGANTSYYNRYVTMRNEISAMANKIWPNGDNKVPDQYVQAIQQVLGWSTWTPNGTGTTAFPGDTVTSQGIWYDLGNVGAGFDNNGDLVPDRNGWLQPIGDASGYDAGCFRLVRTYGLLIVKLNDGSDMLIPFVDQLYFEGLPDNNTDVVGLVFYVYRALDGACTAALTPYQEVASGYDNEKFNADFGAGIPPLTSQNTNMTFDKNGTTSTALGGTINYTLTFTLPDIDNTAGNNQTVTIGDPTTGNALTYYDVVPVGLQYVANSASTSATMTNYTSGSVAVTRFFSTDGGTTWSQTDPGNYTSSSSANQLHIKWELSQGITSPASGPAVTGQVGFSAVVPIAYTGSNQISNSACMKIGDTGPATDGIVCDTHITLVSGNSAITGTVWKDDGITGGTAGDGIQNGTEAGINAVTVKLYWDANGDGDYADAGDFLYATTTSDSNGYYCFGGTLSGATCTPSATNGLPATTGTGRYIIVVDSSDTDIPTGYGPTTTTSYTKVALGANDVYGDAAYPGEPSDFGFAPALSVQKRLDSISPTPVGSTVQFTLTVNNTLPGSGTNSSACVYYVWAGLVYPNNASTPPGGTSANSQFKDYAYLSGRPDGRYGYSVMNDNTDYVGLSGFNIGNMGGNITKVEFYLPVQERANFASTDNVYIHTYYNNLDVRQDQFNGGTYFTGPMGTSYNLTADITSLRTWTWSDFANNTTEMQIEANKGAGSTGDINVDAAAFRITTDGNCSSNSSTILNPVPLTDQFDNTKLSLVSSNPPVTSSSVNGTTTTLSWANVGPLYPGQTKYVKLIFTALATASPTINKDESTGAKFASGASANSDLMTEADNQASVTIVTNATPRSLSGRVFDDNNTNGWATAGWTEPSGTTGYDAGDTGIQGIPLDLYVCVDAVSSAIITSPGNNKTCAAAGGLWVFVKSTSTDSSGNYSFTNLVDGFYYVAVHSEYIAGSQTADVNEAGACATCDSRSADPANSQLTTDPFPGDLHINTTVTNVNFGYNATSGATYNIGDTLFYDWNGNGTQDSGDEGISGVTVRLLGPDGSTVLATTTTDSSGHYLFSGYAPGYYTVQVGASTLPSGVVQSYDPDGAVMDNKSTFNLTATDLTRDFGYTPTGSGAIGDTVFKDTNGDGTQSSTEPGISGVTVELQVDLNNDGTWVTAATQVTNSSGNYMFTGLPAGTYRVKIDLDNSPYANSTAIPNDPFGNDYYPSDGTWVTTGAGAPYVYQTKTLATATSIDLTADFGFAPPASIGDTVYQDVNGNGAQDNNEPGINGVTVSLYTYTDSNNNGKYDVGETLSGSPVATTTTAHDATSGKDGIYRFTGLVPGNYAVVVTTGSGSLTGAVLTGDPTADGFSCLDLTNPAGAGEPNVNVCDNTDGQHLYNGSNYTGADFGYQLPGSFGDTVWIDTNNNGIRDAGENGIPNITITASTGDHVVVNGVDYPTGTTLTTSTDVNGNYSFSGIFAIGSNATWTVTVDTADTDFPSGMTNNYDPDGALNSSTSVVIDTTGAVVNVGGCTTTPNGCDGEPDALNLDADFGYRFAGATSISGTVCLETTSKDGVCGTSNTDPSGVGTGETAYDGVTVYLYVLNDTNGNHQLDSGETTTLVGTAATDVNGDYAFTNVTDGIYYVIAIGAPMSGLTLDSTQTTVNSGGDGSQTTQLVNNTDSSGNTVSAFQVVNTTSGNTNVTDRDFAFSANGSFDYGDLPVSYSTDLQNNPDGARAMQPAGGYTLYLGTAPDTEANGQPTADATGDGSDENGVSIPLTDPKNSSWQDGNGALTFNITGSGWLVGWVDWNRDGDFADANEMVISQAVSGTGNNQTLDITTPNTTISDGYLYARFRLFTSQPSIPALSYYGASTNGEVEDYRWSINGGTPTPVTISYFKADGQGGKVSFEWSTITEVGNIGFNLYAADDSGNKSRLNGQLIASHAPDSSSRQDYSFSAASGASSFYIEDVGLGGETLMHGPYELGLEYGSRFADQPIDWSTVQTAVNASSAALRASRDGNVTTTATSVDLSVNQTGLYRVTYEELKAAGFDFSSALARNIQVTNRGAAVPVYVYSRNAKFGAGSYIEFYGQALDNLYTDTNVYTLQVAPGGARVLSFNAAYNRAIKPPTSFTDTLTLNNQKVYANYAPGNDPWYDTYMLTFNTPKSWDFPFTVTSLASPSAPATMKLTLWGLTQWPQANDHHILVSINGIQVANLSSDGFVQNVFDIDIPANILQEGGNTLRLTLPGDRGVSFDVVVFDQFSLSYPRTFQAKDGRLSFTSSSRTLQVANLPSNKVVVYRLDSKGLARVPNVQVQKSGASYVASFGGNTQAAQYYVSAVTALYTPAIAPTRMASGLDRPAQYLIISHPNFIDGLQPLIQARKAQGFSVSVVDVNDIYARYSNDVFDPQAIQQYIAYAVQNLGTQYVLLVGGDTYDYRNLLGANSVSLIPSLYIKTDAYDTYTPSDALYADVNGDKVPDVAIGRFPVRTTDELSLMIQKTLAYSSKDYVKTAVYVADQYDGIASFKGSSISQAATLPSDWTVKNIYLDNVSVANARTQMMAAMNSGTALVTFNGHSGPSTWTFSGLFNPSFASSLTNAGRPFVAVQWGCWDNYYVDPLNNYMLQALLFSGDKGAAATLGAVSRADSDNEDALAQLLTPRLVQPGMTMGQALQFAKTDLAGARPDMLDMLYGYSLMGDPALIVQP